jgi:hypothetical protein
VQLLRFAPFFGAQRYDGAAGCLGATPISARDSYGRDITDGYVRDIHWMLFGVGISGPQVALIWVAAL